MAILKFLVVDDDPFNNIICKKIIRSVYPDLEVLSFTDPELGLEYLREGNSNRTDQTTILFLDINMPILTGWDFLDQFETFSPERKNQVYVFILSSSIDENDIEKTTAYGCLGFISKPLSVQELQNAVVIVGLKSEHSE